MTHRTHPGRPVVPGPPVRTRGPRPVRHHSPRASVAPTPGPPSPTGRSGWYPMRRDSGAAPAFDRDIGSYPFGAPPTATGVYDIPVGPIGAGLIEPGHFRFSVVGETILKDQSPAVVPAPGHGEALRGQDPAAGPLRWPSGSAATPRSVLCWPLTAWPRRTRLGIPLQVPLSGAQSSAARARAAAQPRRRPRRARQRRRIGLANAHAQRITRPLLRHNEALTGHRLRGGALTLGDARLRTPDLNPAHPGSGD